MNSRRTPAVIALALTLSVTACGIFGRPPGVVTGPDGLRTFTVARAIGGNAILCTLGLAVDPLVGTVAGDSLDPERVWLVSPEGTRVSIVWPEGFTVRFEPAAVLYDSQGRAVARAGDAVAFEQVNESDHAGTLADPYWASGIVFDGCYPPARS